MSLFYVLVDLESFLILFFGFLTIQKRVEFIVGTEDTSTIILHLFQFTGTNSLRISIRYDNYSLCNCAKQTDSLRNHGTTVETMRISQTNVFLWNIIDIFQLTLQQIY